jgi:hypothetical protein
MEEKEEDYYSTQEDEEESIDEDTDAEEGRFYVTRSGRTSKPPNRLTYDARTCLMTADDHEEEELWIEHDLLAYKASTDPDTMYYHQAMRETDRQQFLTAMEKECEAH